MSQITILGGCGTVGSVAVKTLVAGDDFSKIIIADVNIDKAKELVAHLRSDKVSAVKVDANNPESIKEAIKDSEVVLNCIGPFYEFAARILKVVIEAGINYVDVCDDYDATKELLSMDSEAKTKGISALIGMGSSPGIANILVRFCADTLLDEVDSVDIYHAHGGEPSEGAAVVKHRIHSMQIDIPMFLNGEFTTVNLFDETGKALEEEVEFKDVGTYRVYAYPHPETITLPKYIKGIKRVTNLGLVLPPKYAQLIKDIVRLGITQEEPIEVQNHKIIPLEFAISFILSKRKKLIEEAGLTHPVGCLKIVVKGKKNGDQNTYIFSMSSRGQGMGEGTGIPAALGAILMTSGKIKQKGVFPPEACISPMDMLQLIQNRVKLTDKGRIPIIIEHIDKDGNRRRINLPI